MTNQMMRIAGRAHDGNAKAIRTDIEGNIFISTSQKTQENGSITVEPGSSVLLEELKTNNYSHIDFLITTDSSDLIPGVDYEMSLVCRDGLTYDNSQSGVKYKVDTQVNPTTGGVSRTISIKNFERIPVFLDYFSLEFTNKRTSSIIIRRRSVRRFV